MMVNAHLSPQDFDDMDYYELLEIMNAKPRDKRPKTLFDLANELEGRR